MMYRIVAALLVGLAHLGTTSSQGYAAEVEVASLAELIDYAAKSGNTVTLRPGTYRMIDAIPLDTLPERRERRQFPFIEFSGSDNTFQLDGVEIEFDTQLRSQLRAPIHSDEFLVTGHRNTFQGLTITNLGDGSSLGGAVFAIRGDNNTVRKLTLTVRGSYPYGYGDLFGKGGGSVIGHRKQSGLLVTGDRAQVLDCKLYMRSFGHGFYIQGGDHHRFEDCYVEGETRSTDAMLAETSGPAFEKDFRTMARNRQGEARVTPGYQKSLAEDGFRMYVDVESLVFRNCTAKFMRHGFELRNPSGVRLENCQAIGNEVGFWIGREARVLNCRGDAKYGPLLFVDGDRAEVELELLPGQSDRMIHALATIQGVGHRVTIRPAEELTMLREIPILLGYGTPPGGEGMARIPERKARDCVLRNLTSAPIQIGQQAESCRIETAGPVIENLGRAINVESLP
jgi:hypothetical protein